MQNQVHFFGMPPPAETPQDNQFLFKKILNTVEAAQLLDMSPSSKTGISKI